MTNEELSKRLLTGSGEFKVSMSKDGTFLHIDGELHEITDAQADKIWDNMFDIAMIRKANALNRTPADPA